MAKHWIELLDKQDQASLMVNAFKKLDSDLSEYGYRIITQQELNTLRAMDGSLKKPKPKSEKKVASASRSVTIHGRTFKSIAKAAEFYELPASALYTARNKSIDLEDICEEPVKNINRELYSIDENGSVITKIKKGG